MDLWLKATKIYKKKNGIIDMYNKYYEPLLVCYKMLLNLTSTKARESGELFIVLKRDTYYIGYV